MPRFFFAQKTETATAGMGSRQEKPAGLNKRACVGGPPFWRSRSDLTSWLVAKQKRLIVAKAAAQIKAARPKRDPELL